MVAQRLEIRLHPDHKRKLLEIAKHEGTPVSEAVRQLIDHAYEALDRAQRRQAALELGQMEIEEVPDPETLSRQLAETYDLGDLYGHERPDLRRGPTPSAKGTMR